MSKHTPGPWTADRRFVVAADPVEPSYAIYIAEVCTEDAADRIASPAQQNANALLIAAAPDLKHALTLMLREHDALCLATASTEDRWPAAAVARAAIAKATGE